MTRTAVLGLLIAIVGTSSVTAQAYEVYPRDLAGFLAAAGPLAMLDFDGLAPGTDLSGTWLEGVHFATDTGNTLLVVIADETYSSEVGGPEHHLYETTPENVLSPGGIELAFEGLLQEDDLILEFLPPVHAFGLDFLWQSSDGNCNVMVLVLDELDEQIFLGAPEITDLGGFEPPGGNDFWGIVSSDRPIAKIEFRDLDHGVAHPDSNIGFDTIRVRYTTGVPELDMPRSWSSVKALYR